MKQLQDNEIAQLIVLLAVILGGWLRFIPVLMAGFPVNDGGMFYCMIEDLYANHLVLPAFTSYNFISIPYAYPPLAFYIAAAIKGIFSLDTIQILMFLPAAVSTLAILAFLLLSCQIFPDSYPKAALATMAFAMLPRSYSWFVMGGGLTRSFGEVFLLLMLASVIRLYKYGEKYNVWQTGFLGGLVVLSHPEATIHAITATFLFWFFLARNRKGIINSLWVALIVLLVSAPWWLAILWQHGPAPLINAIQSGGFSLYRLAKPLLFDFAEERLANIITVLGMLGILIQISRGDFFLSIWIFVHYITLPRNADTIAIYPLALLSAVALYDMVFPALVKFRYGQSEVNLKNLFFSKSIIWVSLTCLILYLTMSSFLFSMELTQNHLSQANLDAMQWVKQNTPVKSRFLVLSGQGDIGLQTGSEWFPALSERNSELTFQGREWILGNSFADTLNSFDQIQQCFFKDLACLEEKTGEQNIRYEYIYIQKPNRVDITDTNSSNLTLIINLKSSQNYELLYNRPEVIIFKKNRQ